MKLPIKKKYFDDIKSNIKKVELRDAHITFVCEETGETLRRDIFAVEVVSKKSLPKFYYEEGILEDEKVMVFAFDLSSKNTEEAKK